MVCAIPKSLERGTTLLERDWSPYGRPGSPQSRLPIQSISVNVRENSYVVHFVAVGAVEGSRGSRVELSPADFEYQAEMLQDELDRLLAQRIIPPVEKLSQSAALLRRQGSRSGFPA